MTDKSTVYRSTNIGYFELPTDKKDQKQKIKKESTIMVFKKKLPNIHIAHSRYWSCDYLWDEYDGLLLKN
jgi:hypothetical protein